MNQDLYRRLYALETTPDALASTCDYITSRLRLFLRKQEKVLVCFRDLGRASLGGLLGEAVRACGGIPVFWGPDYRWKELLHLAFDIHAHTVIAHPLIILGLMKLAKNTATPLYIYNVVLAGYPYAGWMLEGIKKELDCRVWGCYSIHAGPVVVGFTCEKEAGIHIRDDAFTARLVDNAGQDVADPGRGKLLLISKKDPTLCYDPQETSILMHQPCSCGCDTPRIVETVYVGHDNPTKALMENRFLAWYSILDYRARRTPYGIDLELVVFPGEPLPKLPSCARLKVRPWNPDADIPLLLQEAISFKKSMEES